MDMIRDHLTEEQMDSLRLKYPDELSKAQQLELMTEMNEIIGGDKLKRIIDVMKSPPKMSSSSSPKRHGKLKSYWQSDLYKLMLKM